MKNHVVANNLICDTITFLSALDTNQKTKAIIATKPTMMKTNTTNKIKTNLRILYVLLILAYYNQGKVTPVEFVPFSFLSLLENLNKKGNAPIAMIK